MDNRELRNTLLSFKDPTKCNEVFWKNNLNFDISDHYDIAKKSTTESRLRLLHFKIMHNIYPTYVLLHKMKIKTSPLCPSCQVPDFIEHFFFDCVQINWFWQFIVTYIQVKINKKVILSRKNILIGSTYSDHTELTNKEIDFINCIVLLGKLCINKFKYGSLKNLTLIFEYEVAFRQNISI